MQFFYDLSSLGNFYNFSTVCFSRLGHIFFENGNVCSSFKSCNE